MTHTESMSALIEKYVDTCVAEAVEPVKADRDRLAGALAASEDELAAAIAEHGARAAADEATIRDYRAAIDDRDALIDQLRAALAAIATPPTPEPERPRTILGACPLTGGMSVKGRDNVVQRWGAGTAVRLFASGGFASPAPELGDAGRLLLSWKPDLSRALVEADVVVALQSVPAGSRVCVWHEPDVKARKGDAVEPMKARAREFYAIVKRNRPDLVVMAVLSGWTFEPAKGFDPLDYFEPAACDMLGVDLDGLFGPKDYRPVVAEVLEFVALHGLRWTVAEYGFKIDAGFTNAARVPHMVAQTTALLELPNPPEEICLFEVDTVDGKPYILTTPAEQSAWKSLIGG